MMEFVTGFYRGIVALVILEVAAWFFVLPKLPLLLTGRMSKLKVAVSEDHVTASDTKSNSDTTPPPQIQLDDNVLLRPRWLPPNMPVETTAWLNVVLKQIMQQIYSKDINTKLCDSLNAEFAALNDRSKILSYVYASNLSVGMTPPEIKTIKLLPSDPSRNEIEMLAKVVYTGGFSVELHTQMQLYAVVEAHLKVALVDCYSDMLIKVSPLPDSAIGFHISFSFIEDPSFRLDIQSSVGTFNDLNLIDQAISGLFKLIMRNQLVDPNGRRFKWLPRIGFKLDPVPLDERKKLAEKKKKRRFIGPVAGRLHVFVREASGLDGRDIVGPHDSYVIISFNRQGKKSKVATKVIDPKWDELFTFDVFDLQDVVHISVYDRDRLVKDVFHGHCITPLSIIPPGVRVRFAETLTRRKKPEDAGTLQFDIMFEPFQLNRMVIYKPELNFAQFDNVFLEVINKDSADKSLAIQVLRTEESETDLLSQSVRPLSETMNVEESLIGTAKHKRQSDLDALSLIGSRKTEPNYVLRVTIVQAKGLMSCDKSGLSDPYAVVFVGKSLRKTKTIKKTLSPMWHEVLSFPLMSLPKDVVVEIFHYSRFTTAQFMGSVRIDLGKIEIENKKAICPHFGVSKVMALNGLSTRDKSGSVLGFNANITGDVELLIQLDVLTDASKTAPLANSTLPEQQTKSTESLLDESLEHEQSDQDEELPGAVLEAIEQAVQHDVTDANIDALLAGSEGVDNLGGELEQLQSSSTVGVPVGDSGSILSAAETTLSLAETEDYPETTTTSASREATLARFLSVEAEAAPVSLSGSRANLNDSFSTKASSRIETAKLMAANSREAAKVLAANSKEAAKALAFQFKNYLKKDEH